jgi:hypothetical protein
MAQSVITQNPHLSALSRGPGFRQASDVVMWSGKFWGTVRWLMFAVLLVAFGSTVGSLRPRHATASDFLTDVRNGRAADISIPATSGWMDPDENTTVSWRTGYATWHTAPYVEGQIGPEKAGYVRDQLIGLADAAADQGGRPRPEISMNVPSRHYTFLTPVPALRMTATVLWLLLFARMLITGPGAYANRWAWTWLFTIGIVGPLLYLVAESGAPRRRERIHGGSGFLQAVGWGTLAAVLGAVFDLFGSLPGH